MIGIAGRAIVRNVPVIQETVGEALQSISPASKQNPEPTPKLRRAIDGAFVFKDSDRLPPLAAVVVDNNFDAPKIQGVEDAPLVVEYITEGAITRLLAFVPLDGSVDVPRLGPVRSLRPYALDWALGFGAAIVHVGGSPQALAQKRNDRAFSLDQFFSSSFFWRQQGLPGPHDVLTSTALLREGLADVGLSIDPQWQWMDVLPSASSDRALTIAYPRDYIVEWRYDAAAAHWNRKRGGASARLLATAANNIIVAFTQTRVIDAIGRRSMTTVGTGDLLVFPGAQMEAGQWKRGASKPFEWLDVEGRPIALVPGTTWIEVVSLGTEVEFK